MNEARSVGRKLLKIQALIPFSDLASHESDDGNGEN
jgi:hypothetical protein